MIPLLLVGVAYLVGATPTSYWVGRAISGTDLRRVGSGNLGATNVLRVLGWKAAVPVLLIDVAKGWLPVALFPLVDGSGAAGMALAYGAATILGHVFSFWVGFRGGKGVATSTGVFLALAPWALLIAFGVWLVVVSTTRMVSLGSILAGVTLPLAVWLTPHRGGEWTVPFTVALALFVVWAHRANIARILRGEENRFGSSRASASPEPDEPGDHLETPRTTPP